MRREVGILLVVVVATAALSGCGALGKPATSSSKGDPNPFTSASALPKKPDLNPPAGTPVTITDLSVQETITCDNNAVTLGGGQNRITLHGSCASVDISSAFNNVDIDQTGSLTIDALGNGNLVNVKRTDRIAINASYGVELICSTNLAGTGKPAISNPNTASNDVSC
ncbi:DUF3060 domain-containing protein [Fodinicola acaciae]|uniref:DUF3060 domain-containing protein n=1 Tax=Fodinicola acaciae TaxID=2681555 RepID=UPI0013D8268C|nr:DUF3060 domain-containing protein [Fodinicola acaciae]